MPVAMTATAASAALFFVLVVVAAAPAAALFVAVTVASTAFLAEAVPMAAAALFAVAVAAAAFFTVAVAAAALFTVAVTMAAAAAFTVSVVVAAAGRGRFDVAREGPRDQGLHGFVGRALDARVKADAGVKERLHGAAAEAAADHGVNAVLDEQIDHGTVPVTARGHEFGADDALVVERVDAEGGRHAEVPEDVVVFKGNGYFHLKNSCCTLCGGLRKRFVGTASPALTLLRFLTDSVIASLDDERFAVDKRIGDLKARLFVDFRHRGAGNVHLARALIVGALLQIDKPHRFVLFHKEHDNPCGGLCLGGKAPDLGFAANASAAARSGHGGSSRKESIPTKVGNDYSPFPFGSVT